jgi:hypothetical protein
VSYKRVPGEWFLAGTAGLAPEPRENESGRGQASALSRRIEGQTSKP